jgi:hypothetical protein
MAEPTLVGRGIAAWPSFAFTASFELLTRQVHSRTVDEDRPDQQPRKPQIARLTSRPIPELTLVGQPKHARDGQGTSADLARQA